MKKLSVIIPAYQAERTLEKCIASVLSNGLDLEVLVVNDGSADNTGAVAAGLAAGDARVQVWNRENAGPGAAREFALRHAQGEYITFLDADDYVDAGFYDKIAVHLDGSTDILEYGYVTEGTDGSVIAIHPMQAQTCEGKQCGLHYALQQNTTNFLWNKAFRRGLFERAVFPHLFLGEDAAVLAQMFVFAKKYRAIEDAGCHYVMTPDSLCRKPFTLRKLDNLTAYHFIDDFYAKHAPELCVYTKHKLCSQAVLLYCECSMGPEAHKARCPELIGEYRKNRKSFSLRQLLTMGSGSRRLMLALFELSPKLCARVYAWRQPR